MIKGHISKNDAGVVYRYVTINSQILLPEESWKIYKHTTDPDDWCNWGYAGSGPAQLALAIMLRFCRKEEAVSIYQAFKFDVIAKLPGDRDFAIPNERVHNWLISMRAKAQKGSDL